MILLLSVCGPREKSGKKRKSRVYTSLIDRMFYTIRGGDAAQEAESAMSCIVGLYGGRQLQQEEKKKKIEQKAPESAGKKTIDYIETAIVDMAVEKSAALIFLVGSLFVFS